MVTLAEGKPARPKGGTARCIDGTGTIERDPTKACESQRGVACVTCPGPLCGQTCGADLRAAPACHTWGNIEVYEENDTFAFPGFSSDAQYTQGLRFVFMRNPDSEWPFADWVRGWAPFSKRWSSSSGLVVGQYHSTPRNITTFNPDPTDRPFSAWLYGGIRVVLTNPSGSMRQSFEVDLGPIGPAAFGRDLQGGLHVVKQHRVPKGWDHQIGTALGLNGNYLWQGRWPRHSVFDVTPGLGFGVGTVQTFGLAEITSRLGKGLSGWPLGVAPQTVAIGSSAAAQFENPSARKHIRTTPKTRDKWEFGFFGALQWRYFLVNRYLDGPMGGGPPEVPTVPFVHDLRFGAFLRHKQWRVTYTAIGRSREFEGELFEEDRNMHNFGSIAVSRELPDDWSGSSCRCFLERNWLFEIGMGRGYSSFERQPPRGDGAGLAGRLGIAKGLTALPFEQQLRRRDRWRLGYELVGVVREGGPPSVPRGVHRDDFLRASAATVRWRPLSPARKLGRLDLRAGFGRGTAKRELTADNGEEFDERSEDGPAMLFGTDYMLRLGSGLSFGMDVTWSRLWLSRDVLSDGSFWSAVAVLQWHP